MRKSHAHALPLKDEGRSHAHALPLTTGEKSHAHALPLTDEEKSHAHALPLTNEETSHARAFRKQSRQCGDEIKAADAATSRHNDRENKARGHRIVVK